MDKKDLYTLIENFDKSPSVIKKKNSALFAKIEEKAKAHIETLSSEYLKKGSKELQKYLSDFRPKIQPMKKLDLAQQITEHLKKSNAPDGVIEAAQFLFDTVSLPDQLDDILNPGTPINQNPLFIEELHQAKFYQVAGVAKLSDTKAELALKKQARLTTLNDSKLEKLVKGGDLTDKEAKELGLTASLYGLLDENIELTNKLKNKAFSDLPTGKVTSIKDLISFEEADWLTLIKSTTSELPNKLKPDEYARVLQRKSEALYPNESLFTRIVPAKTIEISQSIKKLAPLFERNKQVFQKAGFDSLDLSGLDGRQVIILKETYKPLFNLINMYPGLKLDELLNDKRLSPEDKQDQVNKEIDYLSKFYRQNSGVNFLSLNYTPDSEDIKKLNFTGIPKTKQKPILRTLKAYQRIYFVTGNAGDVLKMMAAGYHSASEISDVSPKRFIKTVKLSDYQARRFYGTARSIEGSAASATAAALDLLSGGFDQLQVSNLSPSIENYLRKIDGYETLFGSQDYCRCEHCQSVLSPAAYFVDLMSFVEEHILSEPFSGDKATHVLNLKVRRPDLWKLPLTCENTHGIVPYLLIINEILENYIAIRRGYAGNLYESNETPIGDRSAIENFVYGPTLARSDTADPFSIDTFSQPFVLPLAELHTYLSHFKDQISQGEIARLLEESDDVIARTSLQCSLKEYELITERNTLLDFHKKIYGHDFQVSAIGQVDPLDVQELLKTMGLNRKELGDLIATDYITARGADNVRIVAEKRDPNSVQNDIENLHGLKLYILDRMHRFTRLWKKLPWTIAELDLVLIHLEQDGLATGIDEQNTLKYIAQLRRVQEQLQISVEELISLWSTKLPTKSIISDKPSLFDRLFNIDHFLKVDPDGIYPIHGTTCTEGEPAGETNIVVASTAGFNDSDRIEISLDDGSLHITTINGPPTANTIVIANAIPAGRSVSVGAELIRLPIHGTTCTEGEPAGETNIVVASTAGFNDSDRIEISLDDDSLHITTINGPPTANTIVIANAIPGGRSVAVGATVIGLPTDGIISFAHPSFTAGTGPTPNYRLQRLLAGLQVDDETLYQLILHLKNALSLDSNNAFELTNENLTMLYRHAFLTRLLRISVNQLFQLIIHSNTISSDHISRIDDLVAFIDFHEWFRSTFSEWFKTSKNKFDDLGYIINSVVSKESSYPDPEKIANDIINQVEKDNALTFADTVFSFIEGITEEQSKEIIDQNSTVFEKVDDHYQLRDAYHPSQTLMIPFNRTVPVNGRMVRLPIQTTCTDGEPTGERNIVVADISGFYDGDRIEIGLDDGSLHTTTINGDPSANTIVITDAIPANRSVPVNGRMVRLPIQTMCTDGEPTGERNIVVADISGFYDGDRIEIGLDDGSLHTTTINGDPSVNTIVITDAIPVVSEPEIRQDYIRPYHPIEIIPTYLAQHLDLPKEKVSKLLSVVDETFTDSTFAQELKAKITPPSKLRGLVSKLLPLSLLFKDEYFEVSSLDFINNNPGFFDIPLTGAGKPDFTSLNTGIVKKLSNYRSFIKHDDGISNVAALHDIIGLFDSGQRKFIPANTKEENKIANIIGAEWGLIQTLQNSITLPNTPIQALEKLRKSAEVASYLGISGDSLKLMIADNYDHLNLASRAALSAFRAKYTDEKEWQDKIEPFENEIRTKKRDALTDYLIHSIHPEFSSLNDLYHHFFIDVELEGCARTSRVVAAISSLQLYVHRVLMNLEQDSKDPTDPDRVHVLLEDEEARQEWTWRKNYRVWEANRRVFLTPENWIEPELRDNKTPLFEELETELLQQDINEQTVLDAYAKYTRGFEDVANLKIAGAYHDVIPYEKDTLHLIGVTPSDPPTYYYRTIENPIRSKQVRNKGLVYNSWEKINVQIPVTKITPIIYKKRLYIFWVEYSTRSVNSFKNGASKFDAYRHTMSLKYTMLRLDGSWTAIQKVLLLNIYPFYSYSGEGIIKDSIVHYDGSYTIVGREDGSPRYDRTHEHAEQVEGYTLKGFQFDQAYLENISDEDLWVTGANFYLCSSMNFYTNGLENHSHYNSINWKQLLSWSKILFSKKDKTAYGEPSSVTLYSIAQSGDPITLLHQLPPYARCSVTVRDEYIEEVDYWFMWTDGLREGTESGIKIAEDLKESTEIMVINGSLNDCLIDEKGDILYIQGSIAGNTDHFIISRIGTTLSNIVAERLFTDGIDQLLSTEFQENLGEASLPITFTLSNVNPLLDASNVGELDFKGPYGTYYREIFFHIPYLIANHLNSQQKFAEAQKWYHYIFNPTSSEVIDVTSVPSEERPKLQRKRNWRYLEFRNLDIKSLREQLTDPVALIEYKRNPFNPHAIARLRLSAYQKNIVMKYIDNLLDWGDHLFAQDTMESINEAALLYIMAGDILGERPAELGECGEGKLEPKNYETIKPLMDEDNEFLIEMENYVLQNIEASVSSVTVSHTYALDPGISDMISSIAFMEAAAVAEEKAALFKGLKWSHANTSYWLNESGGVDQVADIEADSEATEELIEVKTNYQVLEPPELIPVGPQLIKQLSPVFCIPGNKLLLKYWNRVEDRLYKIRNCMNISGVRRELSLFAPEIDPSLLVRARAAGLSIEDVLNAISGDLPPYRFTYLIEKAKSYASIVQGFGAAMLSALEKKNVEELNRLRVLHQQNTLKMTTEIRQKEIDAAKETHESLNKRWEVVEERRKYYQGLRDEKLISWEGTQQASRHTATGLRALAGVLDLLGGVYFLLPDIGSPFAMKYGGRALGSSAQTWALWMKDLAGTAEAIAASAGLEAGFQRREQGWEHQRDLAEKEKLDIEKQMNVAKIRKKVAEESKKIHEESIKHIQEVYDFYGEKFSDLGLYTWLSTQLHRLFREAYNCAYGMAKLAEQAYRFERSDDSSVSLSTNYWESSRAGLMAGERLMVDLLNLEKRYIETNYRSLEIHQSFSLTQINPSALIALKQTGECDFEIPEIYFDLFYPGHYRRRIKSVRMTVPCITGPYTNISATLRLLDSWIRKNPDTSPGARTAVPKLRTISIATSSAQNDAGVFELNFRDERLLPFEGAGADSSWKLSLPKSFKQFDYQTINDVIIHISYTAEQDDVLRGKIEDLTGTIEGSIEEYLKDATKHLKRVFSLRQEFSNEFHSILHSATGQAVQIRIEDRHFPLCLQGRNLRIDKAKLVLVPKKNQSVANFDISINPTSTNPNSQTGFSTDPQLGNLSAVDVTGLFAGGITGDQTFRVNNAGDLSPDSPSPGDVSAIDSEKLTDILLYLEYGISS